MRQAGYTALKAQVFTAIKYGRANEYEWCWGFTLFSHEAIDRCKLSNRGDERLVLERAEHPALRAYL